MMLSHLLLVACLVAGTWAKLPPVYQNEPLLDLSTSGHSGKPLFLTPYIEKGQIDEAKRLARVGRLRGANVPSYSGYLTVNKTTDSNLFFWFFPALGGPGGSSLFGLFVEHGPYEITKTHFARFRRTTWAQQFNMLYIDNPVGTGYSFTTSDDGYATNEVDVGRDLFEALQQFFTLFSEYAKNEFYITGESYAGKYVPAVAYTIHQRREKANMNLAGIAIGDGLCDPVTMLDYADFALQVGLIDHAQATSLRALQDKAKTLIAQGDFREAERIFDQINGRIMTVSGLEFYYNFLLAKQPASFAYYNKFVQTPKTRRAVHVGNLTYNDGSMVQTKLADDFMRSVKPWIAELMNNNYKVMIYNGQLDIIIASPLTATFVDSINWTGAKDLSVAQRQIWKNPHTGEPAGYVRQAGNFTQVLVRNAGHILPFDQPENAYDMIDRFINNRSFS